MAVMLFLSGILFSAAAVLVWLFSAVKREEARLAEVNAIPITNPDEIKNFHKESSSSAQVSILEALAPAPSAVIVSAKIKDAAPVQASSIDDVKSSDETKSQEAKPAYKFDTVLGMSTEGFPEEAVNQIRKLREEIKQIREKAVVQARESIDIIKTLRDENQSLRDQARQIARPVETIVSLPAADPIQVKLSNELAQRLTMVNDKLAAMETENQRLKAELASAEVKLAEARQLDRAVIDEQARPDYLKQVKSLADEIDFLKRDNATLKASQAVQSEKVSAHSFMNAEAVEALREDMAVLHEERTNLERRLEELENTAREEKEKNSILQYELTKSRAQAVGVERICDNARRKFEGVSREVQAAEQDNILLKKQATVLEQSLKDFKRLNSELSKREGLTQLELENNRAQLRDLENIYQVFRDRLENAGVKISV